MSVGEFLKGYRPVPGNCSTLPADWCVSLGHPDYAERWRKLTGVQEIAEACADGLLPLWEAGIGDALPVAEPPYRAGDIAVVSLHGHEGGGLFTGERWAFYRRRGFAFAAVPDDAILKAWRPCRTF